MDLNTSPEIRSWKLSEYGLWQPNPSQRSYRDGKEGSTQQQSQSEGQWLTQVHTRSKSLHVALSNEGNLTIAMGGVVLESLFLPLYHDSERSCRMFQKKICLIFQTKLRDQSRMFRIKFRSTPKKDDAAQMCKMCSQLISTYIPLHSATKPVKSAEADNQATKEEKMEEDDVMDAASLTKALLSNQVDLPLIYQACSKETCSKPEEGQETLDEFIRLCISDPTFASYVGKVEAALQRITNENNKCD